MQKSDTINELAGAFAKAQGEFGEIKRTRTASVRTKSGYEYSYTYADLSDVLDATRPALSRHGLSISQDVKREGGVLTVGTLLLHSSGQYLSSALDVPIGEFGNSAVQALGGTITYARRYALTAMLNVASEDDDANAAAEDKPLPPQSQPKAPSKPATQGQRPHADAKSLYGAQRSALLTKLEQILGPKDAEGSVPEDKRAPLAIRETIQKADKAKDIKILHDLLEKAQAIVLADVEQEVTGE